MRHISSLLIIFANGQLLSGWTYISLAPNLINTGGTIAEKSNIAVEVGRQWDVFSLGIDIGKTSIGKVTRRYTTAYLEIRPNLNIL